MSMHEAITKNGLEQMLGRPVDEAHILIAKNQIFGANAELIANLLGIPEAEVEEILAQDEYKQVFTLIAAQQNRAQLDASLGYDAMEQQAIQNILKRLPTERSIETNLKIAAVANRAVRRHAGMESALDPSKSTGRVSIRLTERVVRKLTGQGIQEETTRQFSLGGGHQNPSFEEVKDFFNPQQARIREEIEQGGDLIDQENITAEMILARMKHHVR